MKATQPRDLVIWERSIIAQILKDNSEEIHDKTCRAVGVNADRKVFYETAVNLSSNLIVRNRHHYRQLARIQQVKPEDLKEFINKVLREIRLYDAS